MAGSVGFSPYKGFGEFGAFVGIGFCDAGDYGVGGGLGCGCIGCSPRTGADDEDVWWVGEFDPGWGFGVSRHV